MFLDEYRRKTYAIKAVQVTEDNIGQIADWLGVTVTVNRPLYGDRPHVMIPDGVPGGHKKKVPVFIGYWITEVDGVLHREKDKRFRDIFEPENSADYWDWQNQKES